MEYQPTFDRSSKGNFNIDNNFVSIQAGSEAYLLEDEINELQWIQYEQKSDLIRSLMNTGIINDNIVISDKNVVSNENTLFVKKYTNADLNNAVLLSIKNHIGFNLNGYMFKIKGTYNKDVNNQVTTNNNILIGLNSAVTCMEYIFLEMWFEKIDVVSNPNIYKYGGKNNTFNTLETDPRINLETTQKIQLKWRIRSVANISSLTEIYPNGLTSGTKYSLSTGSDNGFYVAPQKLPKVSKVVDNTYYAVPLFILSKVDNQINLNASKTLFNKSKFYLSELKNDYLKLNDVLLSVKNNVLSITKQTTNSNTLMSLECGDVITTGVKIGNSKIVEKNNLINMQRITDTNILNSDLEIADLYVNNGRLKNNNNNLFVEKSIGGNYTPMDITTGNVTVSNGSRMSTFQHNNTGLELKNPNDDTYASLTIGDLIVKGSNTVIEAETVAIADNILLLNSDVPSNMAPTQNAGIEINRGNKTNSTLLWNETEKVWKVGTIDSMDTIVTKTSPVIVTPSISDSITIVGNATNKIKLISSNNSESIIGAYNSSNSMVSSIKFTHSSGLWNVSNNKLATINPTNNLVCDNKGLSAFSATNGGAANSKPAATNSRTFYVGTDDRKIYYDAGVNNWIQVGRPSDIADCDSNFHYDNIAPTGTTRLNYNGYFYATRVYNAVYNDYAEYFEKGNTNVEPGDVIMCDNNNKYIKSNGAYSKLLVGVYSDSYGHLLGGEGKPTDKDNFIPIGLAGRVSVKVIGKIKKGDLLVSSDVSGVAMACENYKPGTVIGKALEDYDSDNIGKIKMFIMNI